MEVENLFVIRLLGAHNIESVTCLQHIEIGSKSICFFIKYPCKRCTKCYIFATNIFIHLKGEM